MQRLTYIDHAGWYVERDGIRHRGAWVDRLAAYEDAGLEPEEIAELKKREAVFYDVAKRFTDLGTYDHLRELVTAEVEGMAVVLPCKPNAAYWHRNYTTGQLELNFEMHSLEVHDDTYPESDSCAFWE